MLFILNSVDITTLYKHILSLNINLNWLHFTLILFPYSRYSVPFQTKYFQEQISM
jgi:hypothetical protein